MSEVKTNGVSSDPQRPDGHGQDNLALWYVELFLAYLYASLVVILCGVLGAWFSSVVNGVD